MHDWLLLKCPDCGNLFRVASVAVSGRAECSVCGLEMIYDDGQRDPVLLDAGEESNAKREVPRQDPVEPRSEKPRQKPLVKATNLTLRASGKASALSQPKQGIRGPIGSGGGSDEWDQRGDERGSQKGTLLVLGGLVAAIAGTMVWMVVGRQAAPVDEQKENPIRKLVGGMPAPPVGEMRAASEKAERVAVDPVRRDEAEQWRFSVAKFPQKFIKKVSPIVENFFSASSVEQRAEFVADRERVLPLMAEYYAKGDEAVGPVEVKELFSGTSFRVATNGVDFQVVLGDFSSKSVALIREGNSWKVDWEAYVRYSSLSVPQLKSERPEEPQLFRGVVSLMQPQYHNFAFSDSSKWVSLMLREPDSSDLLYAYVDVTNPDVAQPLRDALRNSGGHREVTVTVKYPENARADNQVEIVAIRCLGFSELLGESVGLDESASGMEESYSEGIVSP